VCTRAPRSGAKTAARWATEPRLSRLAAWALAPPLLAAWLGAPAEASPAATVAAHTWTTVRTPHVEVVTDATRAVALRVALRLEDLRQALAVLLPPLVVDASPVQVIVFRDASLARAYAPSWRGLQDDVAGFYHAGPDRRRLLFVDDVDDRGRTPSVAQHEYVHSLLDVAYPEAPLWLNEGLAEYFSTFTVDGGRARAGAPLSAHVDWLDAHDLLPLSQLFAVTQVSPDYHEGDRRGTFYAESWALVHVLLSGPEADVDQLGRVIVACRDGAPFETVFAREFGSEQALRERLHGQLEQGRWEEHVWEQPAASGAAEPRVRERTPAAGVLGSLALELLSRPVAQREEAEAHLREALALDARAPDALAGMGWLELMRDRRTEARGWFDRALAVTPVSATAVRVVASQLLLDVSRSPSQADRKALGTTVRSALERALAASPDDPELLALLARSWVVWHGDDAEPGYEVAVRAARALPGRPDVQLDLLALAALAGRDTEAERIHDERFRDGGTAETRRAAVQALVAADLFRANQSVHRGDTATAVVRLESARVHAAGDPDLERQIQQFLDAVRRSGAAMQEAERENRAIAQYNAGIQAGNARRYGEAEAAFRLAADMSSRPDFQSRALRLATRMRQQADGLRAFDLARAGQVAQAIAIFKGMDRASMSAEDQKWLDVNLARLRARQH